jgi:hypothetical protein
MKRLFALFFLATAFSGCVVVSPYDQAYTTYYPAPYYSQPYALPPGYVMPAPVYDAPVYVDPPVQFSFGLNYRSGGGGHRHGFDGHGFRHGHYGGIRRHGFHGWRDNWRR